MSQQWRTSEGASQYAVRSITERLRDLLLSDACLQEWLPHAGRRRAGEINQAAVAQVVASYLWDAGLADEHNLDLARQLKDRIGRAVRGEVLSAETLSWLIHAFAVDDEDVVDLWRLFGEGQPEAASGGSPHRTVSLHEDHYLGPAGLPHHHHTIQVIKALADGLRSYTYRFDTDELEVDIERGGRAGDLQRLGEGLYGVELTLHRPLARGETARLEYNTRFHYSAPPEPVLRRQALRRVENMELSVHFDRRRLPAGLWWGTWERRDGSVIQRTAVSLDKDLIASRYETSVTNAIVGFVWQW